MKGLLTKDVEILKGNMRTYLFVIGVSVIYLFSGKNGLMFFLPYTSFVLSLMVLNTVSYDDFDNGMSYLMTLPVKRSTYVREKYILGLAVAFGGWILCCLISVISLALFIKSPWEEILPVMAVSIFMGITVMAVTLPIQLKFGSEKGQLLKVGVMVVMWLAVLGAVKLAKMLHIDLDGAIDSLVRGLGGAGLFLILAAVLILIIAVSYGVSVHIIQNEEY